MLVATSTHGQPTGGCRLRAGHRLVEVDEQDRAPDGDPELVAAPPGPHPVEQVDRFLHVQGVEHQGSVSRPYPDRA